MVFISQRVLFSVDPHGWEPGEPLGDGVTAEKDADVDDSSLHPDSSDSVAGMEETPHVGTEAGSYCLSLDLPDSFPWGISSGFQLWCPPRSPGSCLCSVF